MRTFGLSKPHPGETVSGDAWLVVEAGDIVRVALVDGAGHGVGAAEAAGLALETIRSSVDRPIEDTLSLCHRALRGSRGAAVSIVNIGAESLLFAGVGNVEARLLTSASERRFVPQRGIAGVALPTIRPELAQIPSPEWALLMYSDGVSQRLRITWAAIKSGSAEAVVEDALAQWGRLADDATLLLVQSD